MLSNISPGKFLIRKYNVSGNRQMEEVENANTINQRYSVACTMEHKLSQETTLRKYARSEIPLKVL